MTIAPIGPQICDRCRHVRAADAAWKHGLISEPEYRNYVRSEEPPYVGSFGYCKMVRTFVRVDQSCGSWELQRHGAEFGAA